MLIYLNIIYFFKIIYKIIQHNGILYRLHYQFLKIVGDEILADMPLVSGVELTG